jgi:hypothetical protein
MEISQDQLLFFPKQVFVGMSAISKHKTPDWIADLLCRSFSFLNWGKAKPRQAVGERRGEPVGSSGRCAKRSLSISANALWATELSTGGRGSYPQAFEPFPD